jgi:hypothetical protein
MLKEEEEIDDGKLKILITNDCELQLEMIKYQF